MDDVQFFKNDLSQFPAHFEKRGAFSKQFETDPIPAAPPAPRGSGDGVLFIFVWKKQLAFQNQLEIAQVIFSKNVHIHFFIISGIP